MGDGEVTERPSHCCPYPKFPVVPHQPQLEAALNSLPLQDPRIRGPGVTTPLPLPLLTPAHGWLALLSPQCTTGTSLGRGAWKCCPAKRSRYSTPPSKPVTPRGQVGGAGWASGALGVGQARNDQGQKWGLGTEEPLRGWAKALP